jgi:hypothetical protein
VVRSAQPTRLQKFILARDVFEGMPRFLDILPATTKDFIALKSLSPWNPYGAFIFLVKQ